jgi:hypothetical protein
MGTRVTPPATRRSAHVDEEARRAVGSAVERAREHDAEREAWAEEHELPPELEQRLLAAFREWRDA